MYSRKEGASVDLVKVIKNNILFCDLPEDIIRQELLPLSTRQPYRKGAGIIEPGDRMEQFGLILSGSIHLMHLYPSGKYSLFNRLGENKVFGADLVCTGTQISRYSAQAARTSVILYFPSDMLLMPGMISEISREKIRARLLTLISNENIKKEYHIAILSQTGIRNRILTYLTMQADKKQSPAFEIPFSREGMAAYLCMNRSALSHELSRMQQEGIISFRKNRFTLLNWEESEKAWVNLDD